MDNTNRKNLQFVYENTEYDQNNPIHINTIHLKNILISIWPYTEYIVDDNLTIKRASILCQYKPYRYNRPTFQGHAPAICALVSVYQTMWNVPRWRLAYIFGAHDNRIRVCALQKSHDLEREICRGQYSQKGVRLAYASQYIEHVHPARTGSYVEVAVRKGHKDVQKKRKFTDLGYHMFICKFLYIIPVYV